MSDKISYILEVLDGYSDNIKKFNDSLNYVGKSTKKFTEQEEKTRKARINYSKIQREEWRQHKQWMHEERVGLSKTLFLKSNIAKTTKASALAEKDNAIAGAINLRTLAQKQLLNKQTVNTLSQVRIQEERIFSNRIRAARMNVSSATLAPSGAFTKVGFNNQLGKFESIEKIPKESGFRYGMAGGMFGSMGIMGSAKSLVGALGIGTAIYEAGRSAKYVHDTTVQMDSLRASLSAVIPKVKGLEAATPEGEIKYIRGVSDKYGLNFSDIAPSYIKILATGGKTDASLAKGLLENIGGYSGLLGLSSTATQDTMRGFQDMLTKQVLQAQEVKLQMQQLPGIQPMFHKAFYRIAKREFDAKGKKSPVTMENASAEFMKSMATGKLSSALMLKEVVKILEEDFGKKMLEKSYKLGNEERRLASATQELATNFGDLTYGLQIGTVRGLTKFTKGLNDITNDAGMLGGYLSKLLSDTVSKIPPEVKSSTSKLAGSASEIVWGGTQIAGMGLTAGLAGLMGNKELLDVLPETMSSKWKNDFTDTKAVYGDLAALANAIKGLDETTKQMKNNPAQKVDVKISTENMPNFFSVQASQPNMSMWRPSTVIAGQR